MNVLKMKNQIGLCNCFTEERKADADERKIVLVGSPNVGKSVNFGRPTGRYVTVSNYLGATVELTRGKGTIDGFRL